MPLYLTEEDYSSHVKKIAGVLEKNKFQPIFGIYEDGRSCAEMYLRVPFGLEYATRIWFNGSIWVFLEELKAKIEGFDADEKFPASVEGLRQGMIPDRELHDIGVWVQQKLENVADQLEEIVKQMEEEE